MVTVRGEDGPLGGRDTWAHLCVPGFWRVEFLWRMKVVVPVSMHGRCVAFPGEM